MMMMVKKGTKEGSPARRENTRAGQTRKIKKDAFEALNKAQEELKKTKYENIKVVKKI